MYSMIIKMPATVLDQLPQSSGTKDPNAKHSSYITDSVVLEKFTECVGLGVVSDSVIATDYGKKLVDDHVEFCISSWTDQTAAREFMDILFQPGRGLLGVTLIDQDNNVLYDLPN